MNAWKAAQVFRKKDKQNLTELAGVATSFGSHHALRAEKVVKESGRPAALIPGPREISPNCGVALRFDYRDQSEVEELLKQKEVHFEAFHYYPA